MASPILMQNENLTKELSKSKVGRSGNETYDLPKFNDDTIDSKPVLCELI